MSSTNAGARTQGSNPGANQGVPTSETQTSVVTPTPFLLSLVLVSQILTNLSMILFSMIPHG